MKNVSEKKLQDVLMDRKSFLKYGVLGVLGVSLTFKQVITADAAVLDNLFQSKTVYVSRYAPSNKSRLWVDTSYSGAGVIKYWNGSSWIAAASVWDS